MAVVLKLGVLGEALAYLIGLYGWEVPAACLLCPSNACTKSSLSF